TLKLINLHCEFIFSGNIPLLFLMIFAFIRSHCVLPPLLLWPDARLSSSRCVHKARSNRWIVWFRVIRHSIHVRVNRRAATGTNCIHWHQLITTMCTENHTYCLSIRKILYSPHYITWRMKLKVGLTASGRDWYLSLLSALEYHDT